MKTDREIRERLIVAGAEKLSAAELLAIIIREGSDTLSAVTLAENILAEFPGGLSQLASAGVQQIRRAAGCGTVRATSIVAAAELARRIAADNALSVSVISSKDDVVKLFAPLAELPHEEFWALYLSSGGRVIDRVRLSQGGVSGTVVDHKLIVKRAVELLASSLILIHNHPSGLAQPSPHDQTVTETVSAAAALFDINVVDHIIVARSGSYSFAEEGGLTPRPHKSS
ncbi:MAG: DNA repair protein RadC [Alistipes sp.]|nr:DNA repair protein RadC [Alistipes sp.]